MSNARVVLVTGGMGGLGEVISTKMSAAGYRVAVTYSPGNTKHAEWVADMKARGHDILAVPCDVADLESCTKAVAEVRAGSLESFDAALGRIRLTPGIAGTETSILLSTFKA